MPFVHRLLSLTLVQLLIELAGVFVLFLLLAPLINLLPNTLFSTVLADGSLAILLAAWFLLAGRFIEHRSFSEIGLPRQHLVRDLLLGFVLGAGLFASIIGAMALAGWYRITGIEFAGNIGPLLTVLLIFAAVAVQEEIIFRGIAFRLLERVLGSWIAIILSALFFGLSHLITPHATLTGALAIAATGGLISAEIYILTRSLWSVFGLHWAWNFFEGPIFGAQVSGKETPVLFHSIVSGPDLWTGGAFGPEASLMTILIGGAVALVLLIVAARRQSILTPPWFRGTRPVATSS